MAATLRRKWICGGYKILVARREVSRRGLPLATLTQALSAVLCVLRRPDCCLHRIHQTNGRRGTRQRREGRHAASFSASFALAESSRRSQALSEMSDGLESEVPQAAPLVTAPSCWLKPPPPELEKAAKKSTKQTRCVALRPAPLGARTPFQHPFTDSRVHIGDTACGHALSAALQSCPCKRAASSDCKHCKASSWWHGLARLLASGYQ